MSNRPELELLLLCVSPVRSERRTRAIRELLAGRPDWKYLEELAGAHGVLPLLYWELKVVEPAIDLPSMAHTFQLHVRSSLLLTLELFRILDIFKRAGIGAIPLKGPTLAVFAYNNLALRGFGDLDILVRPEDAWRVHDLLLGEGYSTELRLSPGRRSAFLDSYDELVLRGAGGYPIVELHWGFVPPHFSVSPDPAIWDRAGTVLIDSHAVPSLSAEDSFVGVCLHGAKHGWSQLKLVCDVAWLITTHALAWEPILARARKQGTHRMVLLACVLARDVLEVPLAEAVARDVGGDPAVRALAREIRQALFGVQHDETAIVRSGILHMRMRERWRDKARYFFRLATRPGIADWQAIDLPRGLGFLYPLVRFPRLARKYWLR